MKVRLWMLGGVAASIALAGSGATSVSAQRMPRVYEPNQPELALPAAVSLVDPIFQDEGVEGGFTFHAGSPSNQVAVAECEGGFFGSLYTDDQNKDELRLSSGWVGENESGECPGAFGTPHITLAGFPIDLSLGFNGKVSIRGKLEASVVGGPGLPPSCIYKGKVKVTGKFPLAGKLTLNMVGKLSSPSRSCLKLTFATNESNSGVITAFGANEALFAQAF